MRGKAGSVAPHGTNARAKRGCLCAPCVAARLRYEKTVRLERAQGRSRKVPAADARRAMCEAMEANHLRLVDIARASGVSTMALRALDKGDVQWVQRDTYERLRKLPKLTVDDSRHVPMAATAIRVHALQAEGWGLRDLAREGMYANILQGNPPEIRLGRARTVIELVQRLGAGPSVKGATAARTKGWPPREAYDRDLLLDPLWDGVGGLLDEQDEATGDEIEHEFLHLVRTGTGPYEAGARVGRSKEWVRSKVTKRHPWVKELLPGRWD